MDIDKSNNSAIKKKNLKVKICLNLFQSVPIYNFPVPQTMKSADPSRMYLLGDPR